MRCAGLVVVALVALESIGAAQGGRFTPPPTPYPAGRPAPPSSAVYVTDPLEPETRRSWYGWQILLADAALVAVGSLGADAAAGAVMVSWFDAPAIHALHGRGDRALLTFGARVGIPLVTILAIAATMDMDGFAIENEDTLDAILVGGIIAFAAFYIWDVATAHRTVAVPGSAASWRLGAAVTPSGGSVGVTGRF